MDAISKSRLVGLHPKLCERLVQLDQIITGQGVDFRINVGLRDWAKQQKLYNVGRSVPGTIVTNALPGYSWHQYGFAIDGCPIVNNAADWDPTSPNWAKVYAAAPQCGLFSGWNFKGALQDDDHLQMADIPESPSDDDMHLLSSQGIAACWLKYFPTE